MEGARVCSFPDLTSIAASVNSSEDPSLEGITTNVKLLLKLLNDHQEASQKGVDLRQGQRFAGMMSILDDVKTRIQKSQISGKKKQAELRRCNTDLKANGPMGKNSSEGPIDEKERMRRDLNMSFAAQKRLGVMCSSLGKEKQIIARELSRKVQELQGMEELLNDYQEQNEKLAEKVEFCRIEHLGETDGTEEEGLLKRRIREAEEENARIKEKLEEARREVGIGCEMLCGLKQRVGEDIEGEIEELERVLEGIGLKLSD